MKPVALVERGTLRANGLQSLADAGYVVVICSDISRVKLTDIPTLDSLKARMKFLLMSLFKTRGN